MCVCVPGVSRGEKKKTEGNCFVGREFLRVFAADAAQCSGRLFSLGGGGAVFGLPARVVELNSEMSREEDRRLAASCWVSGKSVRGLELWSGEAWIGWRHNEGSA